jgi:hypothetical protein
MIRSSFGAYVVLPEIRITDKQVKAFQTYNS